MDLEPNPKFFTAPADTASAMHAAEMRGPQRIQLSSAKGWRMPPNTVKVDRSTVWGNPFTVAQLRETGFRGSDEALTVIAVNAFRDWIGGSDRDWMWPQADDARATIIARLSDLRGHNLACWCKPGMPCHADVLLEVANK